MKTRDAEAGKKEEYFLCSKKCLFVILQLHHKGVLFFRNSLYDFKSRFKYLTHQGSFQNGF